MPITFIDRAKETTTGTGSYALALDGPVNGFQALPVGVDIYYCIDGGVEWEVGLASVVGNSIGRQEVLASSTGGKVNFSAGVKEVYCVQPAKAISELVNSVAILGGDSIQKLEGSAELLDISSWPANAEIILSPVIVTMLCPVAFAEFDLTIVARESQWAAPKKVWKGTVMFGSDIGSVVSGGVVAGMSDTAFGISVSVSADAAEGGGTAGVQINVDCTLNAGSGAYFEATAIMRTYESPSCW